jgi:hypothetical protein
MREFASRVLLRWLIEANNQSTLKRLIAVASSPNMV